MHLNEMKIRNLNSTEKNYRLCDGNGLYLLLNANGTKYWQYRYNFAGKPKTLSLGAYPVVSLSEARKKRFELERMLEDGIDPSAYRKQQKEFMLLTNRNTFHIIASEWHRRNEAVWKPRHAHQTWMRLKNHILPTLGKRPVAEITTLEIVALVQGVEAKGMTDLCVRVLWICSSVFRFAIISGRCQHNPALNLKGVLRPYRERRYPSLRAREIPKFLTALEQLETVEQDRIAFKLLLLTALRSGELRNGRWEDVDFVQREWRIPRERMKMSDEGRPDHIVPLSSQATSLLETLRDHTGHQEWIFPNRCGGVRSVMNENRINVMIRCMGYKGQVVGHGFRSMFSTILNESGFKPEAIERQLDHLEKNKVRAAYNNALYLNERRFMMQWWADFIEGRGRASLQTPPVNGLQRSQQLGIYPPFIDISQPEFLN